MVSYSDDDSDMASGSRLTDRKQRVRQILTKHDIDSLKAWLGSERNPMRTLSSLLFESDRLIQWRAVEALGLAAGHTVRTNLDSDFESVRRLVRRLFWLMNDESGGLCWNAPEAIGEIIFNVPGLLDEYGLLLPTYFAEEPFECGSRWAVARIAPLKPTLFAPTVARLNNSLHHENPVIRGYSILALTAIGDKSAAADANGLLEDYSVIPCYDYESGELKDMTVADLTRQWVS